MTGFIVFVFVMGLLCGMILVDFLWRAKIREKAALGFRLPVWGRLYRVTEDHLP